ncbi:MAG: thrombospondin type 3 repeat-containing protein [Kiritimatiellia bacterium]
MKAESRNLRALDSFRAGCLREARGGRRRSFLTGAVCLLLARFALPAVGALPFKETFEDSPAGMASNTASPWAGQHEWEANADGTNNTYVQTAAAYSTSVKAGSMTNATIEHALSGGSATNVWIDFYARSPRRIRSASVTPSANAAAAFYIDNAGYINALSNDTWITVSSYTVPTGDWTRFTLNLNYASSNWSLYTAGSTPNATATNLVSSFPFQSSATNGAIGTFRIRGTNTETVGYIDNITCADEDVSGKPLNIDSDGDALPDRWELAYTNTLAAMTDATDTDGDGYADWAEWVAGTDPTDTNSYLRITSADLASEASDNVLFSLMCGETAPNSIYAADSLNRRIHLLAADNNAALAKASAVSVRDDMSGSLSITDTNAAALYDSRFYHIAASLAGRGATNSAEEWAMFAQDRNNSWTYLVSVPIDYGASNNFNSTLGDHLARGLSENNFNQLDFRTAGGTAWNVYHYTNNGAARWVDDGGSPADFTVTNGAGFRLQAGDNSDAVRTNCVFVGRSVTNLASLNILTNGASGGWRWNIMGWTHRLKLTHDGSQSNQLGFAQGGKGGTSGMLSAPHSMQGDQLWIWRDNTWKDFYWLIGGSKAGKSGRWWNNRTGTFGDFSLEPGNAYYYRHHDGGTNFTWNPPEP